MDNYKTVDGYAYYYNNELYIIPNTDYYHYFYGIKDLPDKIEQKDIGLTNALTITFTIPDTKPETYLNLNESNPQTLDISTLPYKYSETAKIEFTCPNWYIYKSDPDYGSGMSKKFPIFFERDGDIGKITFKNINEEAGTVPLIGSAIYSVDFKTYVEEFFGNMPNKELCEFNSHAYIPSTKMASWYKKDVKSKMYYTKDYGLIFQVADERYPKVKVYFAELQGELHGDIGMFEDSLTYTFNINDADTQYLTKDSLTFAQNSSDVI